MSPGRRGHQYCTLESDKAALVQQGWEFQQDEKGLYFAINHTYRLVTFRYSDLPDLISSVNSGVFDDSGVYEAIMGLPDNQAQE